MSSLWLFPVLSNITVIPAVVWNIYRKIYYLGVILIFSGVSSILYHIMDTYPDTFSYDARELLKYMDFYFAWCSILLYVIYLNRFSPSCEKAVTIIGTSLTAIVIAWQYNDFVDIPVILGYCGVTTLITFIVRCSKCTIKSYLVTIDIADAIVTVILITAACLFQFVAGVRDPANYNIYHGLWHMCIYIACFFATEIRFRDRFLCCFRRKISDGEIGEKLNETDSK